MICRMQTLSGIPILDFPAKLTFQIIVKLLNNKKATNSGNFQQNNHLIKHEFRIINNCIKS
jgi:hypothetical protein